MPLIKISGSPTPEAPEIFLNAVRRTLYETVPMPAVTEVRLWENDGVIFDDMLRLRIELVPVRRPGRWMVDVRFDAEGGTWLVNGQPLDDARATAERLTVRADMFAADDSGDVGDEKEDAEPLTELPIPLTVLLRHQCLTVSCRATLGTGQEHARHTPVSVVAADMEKGAIMLEPVHPRQDAIKLLEAALRSLDERIARVQSQLVEQTTTTE